MYPLTHKILPTMPHREDVFLLQAGSTNGRDFKAMVNKLPSEDHSPSQIEIEFFSHKQCIPKTSLTLFTIHSSLNYVKVPHMKISSLDIESSSHDR